MTFFKFPSSVRWIWIACLILTIVMSLYRIALLFLFGDAWKGLAKAGIVVKGFFNDAGVVCGFGLLVFLVGLIPSLHLYKHRKGKRTAIVLFVLFGLVSMALNLIDLLYLRDFERRPVAPDFAAIFSMDEAISPEFSGKLPMIPLLIAMGVVSWMWWLLLNWLHGVLGGYGRAKERKVRYTWQGITVAVFLLLFSFSAYQALSRPGHGLLEGRNSYATLTYNPLQLIFKKKA